MSSRWLIFSLAVTLISAERPSDPVHSPATANEVNLQHHSQDSFGQYKYGYSNLDSSKEESRSEDGITKGSYSYLDSNGQLQKVVYEADALNGFRVLGTNIPVAPATADNPKETTPAHVYKLTPTSKERNFGDKHKIEDSNENATSIDNDKNTDAFKDTNTIDKTALAEPAKLDSELNNEVNAHVDLPNDRVVPIVQLFYPINNWDYFLRPSNLLQPIFLKTQNPNHIIQPAPRHDHGGQQFGFLPIFHFDSHVPSGRNYPGPGFAILNGLIPLYGEVGQQARTLPRNYPTFEVYGASGSGRYVNGYWGDYRGSRAMKNNYVPWNKSDPRRDRIISTFEKN